MSYRISRVLTVCLLFLACCVPSFAQDGAHTAYSPYSIYGIGDLYGQGTVRDMSMGGVGIAGRDSRYINTTNPAAISARDTLSVLFDLGVYNENKTFSQGDFKSANNTLNINNFAASFRIIKNLGFMAGISPYSSVGYNYSYDVNDPELLSTAGYVSYTSAGSGGLYQMHAGLGTTFFKRLSLGAQVIQYMGNIEKKSQMSFTNTSFRTISSGYEMKLSGTAGKFGIQYEQPVGRLTLGIGATYKTSANLKGYVTDYMLSAGSLMTDTLRFNIDTLAHEAGRARLAGELGIGVSLRQGERWRAEFDYTYSDWTSSGMDRVTGFCHSGSKTFGTTKAQSFRLGMEYVPNVNDIRYFYKRWSYKAGAYVNKEYYMLDRNSIFDAGITFGVTIPVFKGYNGVSLAVDLGQRGSLADNLIRERYVNFTFGLNAFDIWFQKHRYQ